jgi:hypothetical protein
MVLTLATGLGVGALACTARGGFPYAALFAFFVPMTALGLSGPFGIGRLTIADLVAVPGLVLGLVGATRSRRLIAPLWLLAPPMIIFAYGAAMAFATNVSSIELPFYVGSLLLSPLLLCLYGTTERRLRVLMGAFTLGVTVNALVAIYDAVTPGHLLAVLGTEYHGDNRPPGLTTHSNQLGLLCGMAAPMALYLAYKGRQLPWLAVLLILGGGSLASGSRGGVVGFAFAMLAFAIFARTIRIARLLQLATLIAVGLFVAIRAGLTVAFDRLFGLTADAAGAASESNEERAWVTDRAWRDFTSHMWTGIGFDGSYSAHNYYLSTARGGGLLVALIVVAWSLYVLRRGWTVRHRVDSMPASLAAATLWLVFAIQHNAFNERFLYFPLGLVAAGWLLTRPGQSGDYEPKRDLAHGGTAIGDGCRGLQRRSNRVMTYRNGIAVRRLPVRVISSRYPPMPNVRIYGGRLSS